MELLIERMFIEEAIDILNLIKISYNWEEHLHAIKINKGTISITDTYKNKKGDWHQIFENIEIEILDQATGKIVISILAQHDVKYKKI